MISSSGNKSNGGAASGPFAGRTLKTLQAGRGIAAIGVVLSHLVVLMNLPKYGGNYMFGGLPSVGKFGVDYFFVLSGFIILLAHGRDVGHPPKIGRYVWRRFVRVFPLYWIYLSGMFCLLAAGVGDRQFLNELPDFITYYSLFRFTNADAPLGVAWTLYFEVGFYIVFGMLIFSRPIGFVLLVMWLIMLIFFGAPDYDSSKNDFFVDLTNWINFNFFFGIAACVGFLRMKGKYARTAVFVGGSAIVAFMVLWSFGAYENFPKIRFALGAAFALVIYGCACLEREGKLDVPRFLQFLGDSSYSIYLAHLPLASLFFIVGTKLNVINHVGREFTFAIALFAVVILSCLLYLSIEKPLLSMLQGKKTHSPLPPSTRSTTPL